MKKLFYLLCCISAMYIVSCDGTDYIETDIEKREDKNITRSWDDYDDPIIESTQHSCSIVPGPGGVTLNFSGLLAEEYPMCFEYEVNDGSIYGSSESTMYPSVWINTTYATSYRLNSKDCLCLPCK